MWTRHVTKNKVLRGRKLLLILEGKITITEHEKPNSMKDCSDRKQL